MKQHDIVAAFKLRGLAYQRNTIPEGTARDLKLCGVWPVNPNTFTGQVFHPYNVTDLAGAQEHYEAMKT
jgi:hypothetical protein